MIATGADVIAFRISLCMPVCCCCRRLRQRHLAGAGGALRRDVCRRGGLPGAAGEAPPNNRAGGGGDRSLGSTYELWGCTSREGRRDGAERWRLIER